MGLFDKIFKKNKKPEKTEWEMEHDRLLANMKETAGTPEYEAARKEWLLFMVEDIILEYEKANSFVSGYNNSINNFMKATNDLKKNMEQYPEEESIWNSCHNFDIKMIIFDRSGIMEGLRRAWHNVESINIVNSIPDNFHADYKKEIAEYMKNPRKDIHAEVWLPEGETFPPLTEELIERFNFVVDHLHNMAMLNNPNVVDNNYFLLKEDGTRFEIDYIGSGKPLSETLDAEFPLG